jgi:hypothetical protein
MSLEEIISITNNIRQKVPPKTGLKRMISNEKIFEE